MRVSIRLIPFWICIRAAFRRKARQKGMWRKRTNIVLYYFNFKHWKRCLATSRSASTQVKRIRTFLKNPTPALIFQVLLWGGMV